MDDSYAGSPIDRHTDHARNMIQVALGESLRAIKRVNPNDHLLLKELVRELIIIVVSFRRCHAVDLFHFLQVTPVAVLMHMVILHEHLLTDMILVELVRHDVRPLRRHLIRNSVLLTNYDRPWVQLTQIVFDCILNMDVDFCEDVLRSRPFRHRNIGKARHLTHAMYNFVSTFQQLDTC